MGQQKPFTTLNQLNSLLAGIQPGDYIYYNGTGVLTISSSSANAFTISKSLSGLATIDFGCSNNIWDSSQITANYVKFSYTGTSGFCALFLKNCNNLAIYGGDFTSTHTGILVNGAANNLHLLDFTSHDTGGAGIQITPLNGDITNTNIRGEVYRFAQNPSTDDHPDKGTGLHCLLIENSGASTHNFNTVKAAIYGHDSLPRSGQWPEGGGGSCIEMGSSRSSASLQNMTLYAKAENFYMEPGNGTNPGSTSVQTGGNCFNLWGKRPFPGGVIGWAEGKNLTGAVIHGTSDSWSSPNPSITVSHGRWLNVNQYTGGGDGAPNNVPFPTVYNIAYNDLQQITTGTNYNDTASGTITSTGSGVESWSNSASAAGVLAISGSGIESLQTAITFNDAPVGIFSLTGAAIVAEALFTDSPLGTISLSGFSLESTSTVTNFNDSVSGTLSLTGDALENYSVIFKDLPLGTINLFGSGADAYQANIAYNDAGLGQFAFSGSDSEFHELSHGVLTLTPVVDVPLEIELDPEDETTIILSPSSATSLTLFPH